MFLVETKDRLRGGRPSAEEELDPLKMYEDRAAEEESSRRPTSSSQSTLITGLVVVEEENDLFRLSTT